MKDLQFVKEKLVDYFNNEPAVNSVYIFGSFGLGRQTPISDLDIAVLYNDNIPLIEELRHTAEVSSLLKMERIDLINLNKAPIHLQHEIVSTGVKIFDRIPQQTQDFIENMLEIYHDYQGILTKYRQDLREGLIEEHLNDW